MDGNISGICHDNIKDDDDKLKTVKCLIYNIFYDVTQYKY